MRDHMLLLGSAWMPMKRRILRKQRCGARCGANTDRESQAAVSHVQTRHQAVEQPFSSQIRGLFGNYTGIFFQILKSRICPSK